MKYLSSLVFAAGLGLALTALPASAQQAPPPKPPSATAISSAKEILTMKNANAMYSGAVTSMVQRVKETLVSRNLNYQKDLDEVSLVIARSQAGRSNEIGETMAKIYATDFTEQELKEIVTFYKSPVGQKLLVQEPKSILASSQFMQDWASRFAEEVNQMFRAEMHKRGKDL
jgi:hypothetical protein